MKKTSRRRFYVLLLLALCTTALAQRDTLTMRIPTAIAAGEYAEAKMLIEEAIKTGVITAAVAAEYQRQIQAQERSAASKPHSKSRPSPEDRLGPDGIPLPDRPNQEPDKSEKRLGRVYVTYTKLNNETERYYSGRTSMGR